MSRTELHLVNGDGQIDADGEQWLGPASAADRRILARAVGPVLDVGCASGRHAQALRALGVDVLSLDVAPAAVQTAALGGAPELAASVFGAVPRIGQWRTALLLDGNSGLGGDPTRLIRRLRQVLRPDGRILADVATGPPVSSGRLRSRHGTILGPEFGWAPLHIDDLDAVAGRAGFEVMAIWWDDMGWFCELGTAGIRRSHITSVGSNTCLNSASQPSRLGGTWPE